MATPYLTADRIGAVGVIELARPDKFNAIAKETMRLLVEALDRFEAEGSGIRAVLVCAQGRHFCTGGDLAEAQGMEGRSLTLTRYLASINAALLRLEGSPLPTVAACQGLVLAGGLEIALCCDVIFAASDSRFGDQHAQYGLVPAWGATQRLPRLLGMKRTLDLMYSGRWLDAATAERWRLVNHIAAPDDLRQAALAYCTDLAGKSRPGLRAMKELARAAQHLPLEQGLAVEQARVVTVMEGPDPQEGIRAFQEKRAPRFTG